MRSVEYPGKALSGFNIQDIIGGVKYARSKTLEIKDFKICAEESNPCSGYRHFNDMNIEYEVLGEGDINTFAYSDCHDGKCTWFLNTKCDKFHENIKITTKIKKILIYNNYMGIHHSLLLFSAC